jgi:hypothetical protein
MIRGKKTINKSYRLFFENGVKIGSVRLSHTRTVIMIGDKVYEGTYNLKKGKSLRSYNSQYLARKMRQLFMDVYYDITADTLIVKIDQQMRIKKATKELAIIKNVHCHPAIVSTDQYIQERGL